MASTSCSDETTENQPATRNAPTSTRGGSAGAAPDASTGASASTASQSSTDRPPVGFGQLGLPQIYSPGDTAGSWSQTFGPVNRPSEPGGDGRGRGVQPGATDHVHPDEGVADLQ